MSGRIQIMVLLFWLALVLCFMWIYPSFTPAKKPVFEGILIVGSLFALGTIALARFKL
jgi:uncharacterized BrkB/YihY/UPF0761 family membrane protein